LIDLRISESPIKAEVKIYIYTLDYAEKTLHMFMISVYYNTTCGKVVSFSIHTYVCMSD